MKYSLLLAFLIAFYSNADDRTTDAVSRFIDSQHLTHSPELVSDDEVGVLKQYFVLQKGLVSVLWTYQNGNAWQERLTLLRVDGSDFIELSTRALLGRVVAAKTSENHFLIDIEQYAESDPRCCPSIKKTLKFKVNGNRLENVVPATNDTTQVL